MANWMGSAVRNCSSSTREPLLVWGSIDLLSLQDPDFDRRQFSAFTIGWSQGDLDRTDLLSHQPFGANQFSSATVPFPLFGLLSSRNFKTDAPQRRTLFKLLANF